MSTPPAKRFLTADGSARAAHEIAESLYKIPVLLTIWTRCGKPHCRCTAGHLHGPYHALQWREGAIQRRRYVRAADVPAVRAVLEHRREQRRRERLLYALSLQSWRQIARRVTEYEASLAAERTEV
jgi:hypothetical protein